MPNAERYSIVVKVPPPESIVFIAMPFSPQFDDIKTAIDRAVSGIPGGLRTQMTTTPESPSFIHDITAMTQKARLIVAVCSPENETGVPSPNVMYELGLAQSIGKGVVVLTCDIQSLPANMRDQNVLVYDAARTTTHEVVLEVRNRIHSVLARISNKLTDSAYSDVSVAHARHWMVTRPDLSEKVLAILSFAKDVHNAYQEWDTGYVDYINKRVGDLVRGTYKGPVLEERRIEFENLWAAYVLRHKQTSDHSLRPQRSQLEATFDGLQSDVTTHDLFAASRSFFQALMDAIETYQQSHCDLVQNAHGGVGALLRSASLSDFRSKVAELSRTMKSILVYADRLIFNLISVIVEERRLP